MGNSNETRKYKITDIDMFEQSRIKRSFFLDDKTDLVAFDADFADPFEANWLAQIEAAEILPTDEISDDELSQLTEAVEDQMVVCREKFQGSKYFIEKAFPGKPKIWNEFGYDNYGESSDIQKAMINFMIHFHGIATKYKTQLIAAGYSQAKIDEIKTFGDALIAANFAQENFKGNQPVKTGTRIETYNEVWAVMVRVCTAGKTKFRNNFAKYQRYLLPPGEESPEAISITGLATDSSNGNPLGEVEVTVNPGDISTATAANGHYNVGALPDGDYTATFALPGYVEQTINFTITGGNAVELNVQLVHV